MKNLLKIDNLKAATEKTELLHGISFCANAGETVAILGANGVGKSTLLRCIAGNTKLNTSGSVVFDGEDISKMSCDERARKGIFLSFQEPVSIPGLTISELLRSALEVRGEKIKLMDFKVQLAEYIDMLRLPENFANRDLSSGFSGGEKKKLELLQLLMLKPKLLLLDEIDSGLDFDATKLVAETLLNYQKDNNAAVIIVSHNMRILDILEPTNALLISDGSVAETGIATIEKVKKNGFRGISER